MTSIRPASESFAPHGRALRTRASRFARLEELVRRARRHRFFAPGAFVALAAIASLLAWFRFVPRDRDILWAEDGRNFLQNAIDGGAWGPILRPYAGYLHTIPRIIAGLTVQFAPVSDYALWMTAGSCAVAGIMAAIVFSCSSAVVTWLPARVMLAALTVLLPLAPREVLGNTANLHSLALWTLVWVLLYRPRTRIAQGGLTVFALLAAMTEIQSVALLPLLIGARRDARRWPVCVAYLVGITAQLFATLLWPRHHNGNPKIGLPSLLYGYLFNSAVPTWVPQHLVGSFAASTGIFGCALLALPFAAALVGILRWGDRRMALIATGLVVLSVIVYVASIEDSPRPSYDYAALSSAALVGSSPIRYGVVPGMLLCALIPIALSLLVGRLRARRLARPRFWRTVAAVGAGVLVVALVAQFVPPTRRSRGPEWQPEVAVAALECTRLPDSVAISLGETIGWHVDIPCRMLEP